MSSVKTIHEKLASLKVADILRHASSSSSSSSPSTSSSSPTKPFLRHGSTTTAGDATSAVIDVPVANTVESSLAVLIRNRINSAPILDESGEKYIGMVSTADLVSYAIALHSTGDKKISRIPEEKEKDPNDLSSSLPPLIQEPSVLTSESSPSSMSNSTSNSPTLPRTRLHPSTGNISHSHANANANSNAHSHSRSHSHSHLHGTHSNFGLHPSSSHHDARDLDDQGSISSVSSSSSIFVQDEGEDAAQKFLEVVQKIQSALPVPISLISHLSERDPLVVIGGDESVLTAIRETFAKGVHRVLVTQKTISVEDIASNGVPKDKVIGLLSQSDIIRYIVDHLDQWREVLDRSIADLGLSAPKEIISITANSTVIQALEILQKYKISSVAVVDPTHRLLGVISTTDVLFALLNIRRGILKQHCSQFIQKIKTKQMLENEGRESFPAIQTSPNVQLSQLVRLLVATNIHRIYVTQNNTSKADFGSPIGVVSMTDILRCFAYYEASS